MQVGRDETVRVVLYSFEEPAIISPAYLVFEVIDKNISSEPTPSPCGQCGSNNSVDFYSHMT